MSAQPSISKAILALAAARGTEKSICPSEVARALWPGDWRDHMEDVRAAAFQLRDAGKVRVTQGGQDVVGSVPVGPIRIVII